MVLASNKSGLDCCLGNREQTECKAGIAASCRFSLIMSLAMLVAARSSSILAC